MRYRKRRKNIQKGNLHHTNNFQISIKVKIKIFARCAGTMGVKECVKMERIMKLMRSMKTKL